VGGDEGGEREWGGSVSASGGGGECEREWGGRV
jgi:hypothetical protein